ncbi:hypothetical protein CDAR_296851 [Caerostris darwini]|uniref:Uncharacterized protein n=1 Tax=Caerostris darwini TaxID=1538125 RepID=A0AAV4N942_9ARAC|nr:hypothetical protein CDAR_296851 [Caerostris darwini]
MGVEAWQTVLKLIVFYVTDNHPLNPVPGSNVTVNSGRDLKFRGVDEIMEIDSLRRYMPRFFGGLGGADGKYGMISNILRVYSNAICEIELEKEDWFQVKL